MWSLLEKIAAQLQKYSTFIGQLWYLTVFLFRMIVVVTLGGSVYGDEQSAFRCNTKLDWCLNICYDQFARISHLRFWGFQLLAVTFPTVLFHFFSLYMAGQIHKLKQMENALESNSGEDSRNLDGDLKKIARKRRIVGNVKTKQSFASGEANEIPITSRIHLAYYVSTVMRLCLEGLFVYLGYRLFYIEDPRCSDPRALFSYEGEPVCNFSFNEHYLMMTVPAVFKCQDDGRDFLKACAQHHLFGPGYIACFTSRPWEKTIFLRYMNILSGVSFILCALELVWIPVSFLLKHRRSPSRSQHRTVYIYRDGQRDQWEQPSSFDTDKVNNRKSIEFGETSLNEGPSS